MPSRIIALIFLALSIAFVEQALTNYAFQNWLFARHHNVLSWYIRPLLLIPIMLAAWWRSWAGLMAGIFALLTSMVWFPAPAVADANVAHFLADEVVFLRGGWTLQTGLYTLAVLAYFALLLGAAWQRSGKGLAAVLAAAAVGKVAFSLMGSGASARTLIAPALLGLAIGLGDWAGRGVAVVAGEAEVRQPESGIRNGATMTRRQMAD